MTQSFSINVTIKSSETKKTLQEVFFCCLRQVPDSNQRVSAYVRYIEGQQTEVDSTKMTGVRNWLYGCGKMNWPSASLPRHFCAIELWR